MASAVKQQNEETLLKLLAEEAPVGVCIMQNGKFCYVNSYFPIAIGYTANELIGRGSLEIVAPEDREMVNENTRKMLKRELLSPYQFRVICKDGSTIWVMATVRSVDYHGKQAIMGSYMEVTERRKMVDALRENEEQYRLLANSITDVFFAMDEHLTYTYWNKASEVLTGIRAEDAIGKSLQEIFPDTPWRSKAEEMYRQVLKTRQPQTFVNNYDVDGRHCVFEISAYPSQGGISVLVRDITEHKHAEDALQTEKNKLQSLIDSLEDTVTIQDTEYNIIYQNEPSRITSGGDHLGEKCYRAYEGRDKVCDGCPVEEAFKDGKSHTSERKTAIAGEVAFWENTASPIRDAEGRIVSCLEIARDVTERRRQEQALADEVTRRRILVDQSRDGIAVLDRNGKVCEANQRFAEMLGYSLEEVRELYVWDWEYLHPRERILEMLRTVDETGDHFETQHRRKDGSICDIEISTNGAIFAGEKLIFCVCRDITERKQAEEALRQSEERYRTILDEMEDAYFEVDLGGHLTFVNNSVCRDLGYSREELIGMSYKAFTAENNGDSVFRVFNEVYQTGVPNKGFPWKTIRKNGVQGFAETSISPLRNHRSEIIGFRGVGRDITERKQTEEKLRQSRENYRALFDSSVIGALVVDAETMKVVMANQATLKMFGFSSPEEGVNPLDFVPPEYRDRNLELITKELFEKDSRMSIDLPAVTRDGREIWVSATGARIMHRGRLAALLSFTDITEHKQAEEALRQSEERYRTILEEMEDAYFEVDLGGHLTFANNAVCRDLGYSRDELIGMSYKTFTAEDDVNSVFGVFNEVYRTSVPNKGLPWRTIRKDGTRGFAETSISLLRNDRGEIIGFRGVGRDITERKKAEETANLQKAYFQQLFDNSPDAILMTDTNDRAIQANRAFEALFGYSNEEVKNRSLIELIVPEEDTQEASDSFSSILGGAVVRKERVRRRKDGSLVNVSVLAYPIRSNGRLVGAYGVYSDITERKKQEQALADELTRRRLLIDQSLDGIVVLDVDARVVEANPRFAQMLGYTPEEVHELHTWDWDKNFPPEKILEMGRNVDETGFRLETKHSRKDGSVIDVDISINGATCAGQKLIFCVCRDVTARKKMAEAVKLAAEEWSTTIDSISDAVSIHDRDFRILRANKAFADLFGKSLKEIIGIHCYELHKGNEPKSDCPHQHTLTTGKPAAAEFYESHLGKHLLESTSPIFNEQGETVGTVHITRDITEQKRQNERLLMADRLASLGELAAGTAHELNNPLTSIIGFSQLLMEKEVPDDIHEDLKLINNEAQRAANVTRNLLAFARKYAPVKQLNQINSIIEDVLELRAYEQKINSIDVERHLAPDLPKVMVDYFQMQQVFMNIIINAEYFMTDAHKGGTMTITAKKQNGTVRISIADDGPGIPEEDLGRIFDPFFTTKPPGRGTGLGLSICHGIVGEHGGQIYVRSQLGKGATFVVELPIRSRGHSQSAT